ncbi:Uma2 family endonuclease [Amycolatopsis sp. NPDC051128]|uniref:Uma2 family endonuclease n=1 Tax=Amycolatopsis sp. NPDC051128 TaxID=3155412 RepID=UPI003440B301
MSVMEWPHRFLTLDDWAELPETREFHVEVVEGVLAVSPRPLSLHQRAINRLTYWLEEQLPAGYSALQEVEIVIDETPLTVRVPDVIVVATDLVEANPPRYDARAVRMAIEVLSEGSRRTDRVTKFSEYAEAGIEHYWIVDIDPPASMITYRLINEVYEDFGERSGHAEVEFDGTPLKFDLNALTSRTQRP